MSLLIFDTLVFTWVRWFYHQLKRSGVSCLLVSSCFFFFSSRRRHTRFKCDWSSDVCSSDLPLADIRAFVAKFRSYTDIGALPPVILAALRRHMVALAGEIADGLIFANASRSHMADSLAAIPAEKRADPNFLVANMIPTCISDHVTTATA